MGPTFGYSFNLNNIVYFLGGVSGGYQWFATTYAFTPGTGVFTAMDNVPSVNNYGRSYGFCFAINNIGYVGMGFGGNSSSTMTANNTASTSFLSFDPTKGSGSQWTVLTPYPGNGTYLQSGASLNGMGYAGFGNDDPSISNSANDQSDFWQYNPGANTWTQMQTFPGGGRELSILLPLCNKLILIGGETRSGSGSDYNDIWEFDPSNGATGTWTEIGTNVDVVGPGGGRAGAAYAVYGDSIYLGMGHSYSGTYNSDWYQLTFGTDFTASNTYFCSLGNTVNFTSLSPFATSWSWTFSGGSPSTSAIQNPVVTYNVGGTYNVSLTTSPYCGTGTKTKTGFITANSGGLNGTYTIDNTIITNWPGGSNFNTFREAFAALQCQTGPVIFNVNPTNPYYEANLTCTVAGVRTILFQPDASKGAGHALITSPTSGTGAGSGSTDAFIFLQGTDSITFDRIDLQENASNIGNTSVEMEWGYAVFKNTVTDGAQNIIVKNCNITMDKTNTSTIGIYSENVTPSAPTTQLTITNTSGANSYNTFYGNTISNVHLPIRISGNTTYYDLGVNVGKTAVTANTISNFAGSGIGYGIYCSYQDQLQITNNSINTGSNSTTFYVIYNSLGTNNNANINGNTISNCGTSAGAFYCIYNTAGGTGTNNTINIYSNTIQNNSPTTTFITNVGIYSPATAKNLNIYSNSINNNSMADNYWCIRAQNAVNLNLYGNRVYSNTTSGAAIYGTLTAAITYGHIYDNLIYSNSNTNSAGSCYGFYVSSGTTYAIDNNMINNLTATTSTSNPAINGIYINPGSATTGTVTIAYNSINLSATSTSASSFGTAAINTPGDAAVPTLIFQDNLIVNKSTPGPTSGKIVALWRSSNAALGNIASTSDYNDYYAGTPGASHLIYYDGTNSEQTMANYQTLLGASREAHSISIDPGFSSNTDLHAPTMTNSAGIASMGEPITITYDIDGQARNLTAPDLGYDEFTAPSTLPIELIYFNAQRDGSAMRVRCDWSTASQTNNDYFAIERSQDGNILEQIGTVQGAGTVSTSNYYAFYDPYPYSGWSYYRLKQVDYNGKYTYSGISSVYIGYLDITNIYPNPSTDNVTVSIVTEQNTDATAQVYNILGQIIYRQTISLQKGKTDIKIPVSEFATGQYLFKVSLPSGDYAQRILSK